MLIVSIKVKECETEIFSVVKEKMFYIIQKNPLLESVS